MRSSFVSRSRAGVGVGAGDSVGAGSAYATEGLAEVVGGATDAALPAQPARTTTRMATMPWTGRFKVAPPMADPSEAAHPF